MLVSLHRKALRLLVVVGVSVGGVYLRKCAEARGSCPLDRSVSEDQRLFRSSTDVARSPTQAPPETDAANLSKHKIILFVIQL